MPERSPRDAGRTFIEALQRAVSCVSNAVIVGSGTTPREAPYVAMLNRGFPVRLPGDMRLWLSVHHHYRIAEAEQAGFWQAQTVGYFYALGEVQGPELIAYHWHPHGRGAVTAPHLHLRAASKVEPEVLTKVHLPTGLVSLQAVIRIAIVELGVRSRRSDWDEVLTATFDTMQRG